MYAYMHEITYIYILCICIHTYIHKHITNQLNMLKFNNNAADVIFLAVACDAYHNLKYANGACARADMRQRSSHNDAPTRYCFY